MNPWPQLGYRGCEDGRRRGVFDVDVGEDPAAVADDREGRLRIGAAI